MNWSGAKNWLIVLFIGVNLFLAFTIIWTDMYSFSIDKETIASTAEIMRRNGIEVDKECIPSKMPTLGPVDVANSIIDYDALAVRILGDGLVKEQDKPAYTNDRRRLLFDGDTIYYYDAEPGERIEKLNEKDAQSIAAERLRFYGFDMERAQFAASLKPDGDYLVTVSQKLDKYVLFDSYFYVLVSKDGVKEFSGSWFTISGSRDMPASEPARVKSIVSVLLDFARDERRISNGSSAVEKIDLGYMTKAKDTYHKNAAAMPVWIIRCSDGKVYEYDAR